MTIPTILSGAAGRALRAIEPLRQPTGPIDALRILNRAMPDMTRALGDDAARTMGRSLFDAARRGTTRTAASREQVREALDVLGDAASTTARRRVVFGALALGGGIGGVMLLRDRAASDGVPMAPSPLQQPGAPDLPSGANYA